MRALIAALSLLVPPTLPTKAAPNSLASFRCPRPAATTLDMEACAARRLLKLDAEFNRQSSVLWWMLDARARRAFARGQRAWAAYIHQECTVQYERYTGGTAAGIVAGNCEVALTRARVREVTSTIRFYCSGVVRRGPFARCPPGA